MDGIRRVRGLLKNMSRCSPVRISLLQFAPGIENTGILGSVCDCIPVKVSQAVAILRELRRSAEVPSIVRLVDMNAESGCVIARRYGVPLAFRNERHDLVLSGETMMKPGTRRTTKLVTLLLYRA